MTLKANYKPNLNVGELLTTEYALAYYVRFLFEHMQTVGDELEAKADFSINQYNLYAYSLVEGQVSNGGFVQLIFNKYDKYLDGAISALEGIGQIECKSVFEQAQRLKSRSRISFFLARLKGLSGLFNTRFYQKHKSFDDLDNEFYEQMPLNDELFRKFIWENRAELIAPNVIPDLRDGLLETRYESGALYQEYSLTAAGINGWYEEYYEQGGLKIKKKYAKGAYLFESAFFKEDGLPSKTTEMVKGKVIEVTFNEKGKKRVTKTIDPITGKQDGEMVYWYPNGKMESKCYKRGYLGYGQTKRFYDNGNLKSVGKANGYNTTIDEFYLEDGTQTIENGRGLMKRFSFKDEKRHMWVEEFSNGVRHGKSELVVDGVVTKVDFYLNGQQQH